MKILKNKHIKNTIDYKLVINYTFLIHSINPQNQTLNLH